MSNTFKGTPRPWYMRPTEAKNEDGTALFHDIIAGDQWGIIASPHASKVTGVTAEQEKANAQLISCAPDLLEMFKRLNSAIDAYINDMTDNNLKAVNEIQRESLALIARATTI